MIVTDAGFAPDDWTARFVALADLAANDDGHALAVDLLPTDDPVQLRDRLAHIDLIRVSFPSFSDGRGFTIGHSLRAMGYCGRLRAAGHVIADQYAMARRDGFDEVEISADLAQRQPESDWLARANWRQHDYQKRLRG